MGSKLTLSDRNTIRAIENHLKTVDYQSVSATYIYRLLRIIGRLTADTTACSPQEAK